jgi:hypothetical protein
MLPLGKPDALDKTTYDNNEIVLRLKMPPSWRFDWYCTGCNEINPKVTPRCKSCTEDRATHGIAIRGHIADFETTQLFANVVVGSHSDEGL